MKLRVIVGNHNGLTEDVLVFLNDEEKVEQALADLKERYGIPEDEEAGCDSSVALFCYELDVKADLFLVLQETDELYSIAGEETTKKVSGTFSETAIKYECEDIKHCRFVPTLCCVYS